MPVAGNTLTRIVVHAETGRARTEVIDLLRATSVEASKTSREVNRLTDASLNQQRIVASSSKALEEQKQKLREMGIQGERAAESQRVLKRDMDKARQTIIEKKQKVTELVVELAKNTKVSEASARAHLLDASNTSNAAGAAQKLTREIREQKNAFDNMGITRRKNNQITQTNTQLEVQLKNEIIRLTGELVKEQQALSGVNQLKRESSVVLQRLNTELRAYKKELADIQSATKGVTNETNSMTASNVAAANVVANLVTGAFNYLWETLTNLIKTSTVYASRIDELGIALRNVAKITGNTQSSVFGQELAIKRLGITTEEARRTLLKFAAANLDLSKAASLARAAQDLAVISGEDSSETLDKLVHGITTLQIRVLRTAGVYVSLQSELKKASAEQNRSMLSFSEAEKQQLLLNATLNYAARATGTYEEAMTNAGKQMRSMNRYALEAQAAFGQQFQGIFLLLVEVLTELLKAVAAAPTAFTLFGVSLLVVVGKMTLAFAATTGLGKSFLSMAADARIAVAAVADLAKAQAAQAGTAVAGTAANTAASTGGGAVAGGAAKAGGLLTALGLSSPLAIMALVAGITALLVVIYKYVMAQKEATFAKSADIELTNRQIKVNREDAANFTKYAAQVRRVGKDYGMLNEHKKEYALALGRLNISTADAIRQEGNLALALEKTSKALLERNAALEDKRNRLVNTDIKGLVANRTIIEARRQDAVSADEVERNPGEQLTGRRIMNNISSLWNNQQTINDAASRAQFTAEAQDKLNAAIGDSEKANERLALTFVDMRDNEAKLNGVRVVSVEQLLAINKNLDKSSAAYRQIKQDVEAQVMVLDDLQRKMRDGTMDFIEFREVYEKALDDMKVANIDASRTEEGLAKSQRAVMSNLENSIKLFGTYSTAIGVNQQGLKQYDDDLAATSQSQEDYNRKIAELPPALAASIAAAHLQGSKGIERHGEAAASFARRIDDVNRRLRTTIREIQELNAGVGEAGALEGVETLAQGVRGRQQAILQERILLEGTAAFDRGVGGGAEEQEAELRRLKSRTEIIEAHRTELFRLEREETERTKAFVQYQQVAADYADTRVRLSEISLSAETMLNKAGVERLTTEKALTAEIRAQATQRERQNADIQQGFDSNTRLAILRQIKSEQDAINEAETRGAETRARIAMRDGSARRLIGLGELNNPIVDVPNPTRPEVVFAQLAANITAPVDKIAINTGATVTAVNDLNTWIAELVAAGISEKRESAQGGAAMSNTNNSIGSTASIGNLQAKNSQGAALIKAGQLLGVSPLDLASIIGFETGGTYSPSKNGPTTKWGQHFGLIQFGEKGAAIDHKASRNQTFEQQLLNSVVPYIREKFQKAGKPTQGASLLDLYSSVLTGGVGSKYHHYMDKNNTTPMNAVNRIQNQHGPVAMNRFFTRGDEAAVTPDATPPVPMPAAPKVVDVVTPGGAGSTPATTQSYIDQQASALQTRANEDYLIQNNRLKLRRVSEGEDGDPVVSVDSNTFRELPNHIILARQNMDNLADTVRELEGFLGNITNEFDVQNGLLVSLSDRYKDVRQTAMDLEISRQEDASGFFQSTVYQNKIIMDAEIERRQAARDTRDEIIRLQEEITHAHVGSADRIKTAELKARLEVAQASENAAASRAADLVKLEDAESVHLDRIQSRYVGWAANQKSLDDLIYESHTGMMEGVFGVVDSSLSKITSKLGVTGDLIKNMVSGLIKFYGSRLFLKAQGIDTNPTNLPGMPTSDALSRSQSIASGVGGALGIGGGGDGGSNVGRMFVGQLIVGGSAVTQGVAGALSNSSGSGSTGSGGLPIGGAGSVGGFGGFPTFGGNSPGGGPAFNPNAGVGIGSYGSTGLFGGTSMRGAGGYGATGLFGAGGANARALSTADRGGVPFLPGLNLNNIPIGGGVSTQAGGGLATIGAQAGGSMGAAAAGALTKPKGFFNSGLGASIGMMLPGIGAGLGGAIGGNRGVGGIFGQAGGALGGLAGLAALTGPGFFGTGALGSFLGGASAVPILAPIAGALLLGGYILNRNRQRRADETTRNQAIGDANAQLDKLISDVTRGRIDGRAALSQAAEIRANYMTAMGQLKDRKARDHALLTVREIDARIAKLKTAATQQERRQALDSALVPEFATGGRVMPRFAAGGIYNPTQHGNVVPGIDRGHDSVLAMVRPGEVVLNRDQQQRLAPALAIARVPGFNFGGLVPPSVVTSQPANSKSDTGNIYIVADKKFAEQMAVQGKDKILQMSAADMKDEGILHSAVRRIK